MSKSAMFEKIAALICVLICAATLLLLGSAKPAWAAEVTVDSTADAPDTKLGDGTCAAASGDCTLRAAVQESNFSSYDTIVLPAGEYTLSVEGRNEDDAATGDLDIVAGGLTIEGAGRNQTTVNGRGIDRVFDVRFDTWATVSGTTITGGDPGFAAGGGVRIRGQLELYDSAVINNTADSGGGLDSSGGGELYTETTTISNNEATDGHGGGVYHSGGQYDGYADFELSTVSNNSASEFGGGIYSTGNAWMWNSTLSGNTAIEIGGGIRNFRNYLGLENVTLADNSAPEGANLANDGGETEFWNTIVAGGPGDGENCSGDPVASYGNNLDSGISCGFGEPSDLSDIDPQLAELRNNGGPTLTHALASGSPGLDAASEGYCPRTDQRGAARPSDGDGDGQADCDIGAYEFGYPIAKDDAYEVNEDEPLTVPTPGVLDNDTDPEEDPLTAVQVEGPYSGLLTLAEDGSLTYEPGADFNGEDSFTYKATDGQDESNTATVIVTVAAVNDQPVANPDSATTQYDTPVEIKVLSNDEDVDGDQLTVSNSTQPSNGQVECTPAGDCTYTPNAGFTGEDSFDYTASDGNGGTNTSTVSVTVEEPSSPPETNITSGPEGLTNSATVAFDFSSDRERVTYECKLDSAAFEECDSPKEYTSLTQGPHTFEVRAVGTSGQPDASPAKRTFTVDTNAPTVKAPAENLISPSQLGTSKIPVRINWSGSDDRSGIARYELQRNFNGGSFSDVSLANSVSSTRTINLAPANHRFRVRAQDKAGNWSAWKAGPNFSLRAYQEGSRSVVHEAIFCAPESYCPNNTWTRQAIASAYGGYVKHNDSRGAEVTFTFTGRKVAWVSRKSPRSGRAKIYIDGTHVRTVDLYSAKGKARQVVFTKSWSTSGTHTLTVDIAGQNSASGGRRVDIDAFVRIN